MARLRFLQVPALASVLLISGCFEAPENKDKEIESLMVRAEAYANQSQYRAAVIEAKNILQKDPDNIDAKLIMANINIDLGGLNYASDLLEKIDTKEPRVRLLLAKAYILQGKIRSALKITKELKSTELTEEQQQKVKFVNAYIAIQSNDRELAKELFSQVQSSKVADKQTRDESSLALIKMDMQKKDFVKAEKALEKLLATSPKFTDALVLKSKVAYKNNNLEEAEDLLTDALITLERSDIITDKRIMVLRNLSHLLAKRGRPAEAMLYNQLIADARPDDSSVRNKIQRAVEAYEEGRQDEAEKLLTELYEKNKTDYIGMLLGAINLEKKNYGDAYKLFATHIDPETASPEALNMLTEAQLRQNKPKEVLEAIEINVKKNPNDAQQHAIHGLAAIALGDEEKGIEAINKALALDPSKARLRTAVAGYYNKINQPQKAAEQLELAVKESPNDTLLRKMFLEHLIINRQETKALNHAKKYAKENPTVESRVLHAQILEKLKQSDKAVKIYQNILETHPGDNDALRALSIHHLRNKQSKKAIEYALRLIEVEPNDPYGYQVLYSSYDDKARNELTTSLITKIETTDSLWAPTPFIIVNHLKNNDLAKAEELAEALSVRVNNNLIPKSAAMGAWALLAKHYASKKDVDGIRTSLLGALSIDPSNADLTIKLIENEIDAGQLLEADKLIANKANEAIIPGPMKKILQADVLAAKKEYEAAITQYQEVWKDFKSNMLGIRINETLIRAKAPATRLKQHLTEWSNALPNSSEALTLIGNGYLAENNTSEAFNSFKRALTSNPNNAFALNNLAWIEHEQGDLESAVIKAERAFRLAPQNASIADTYGWILHKMGKKTDAIKILDHAAKLAPTNSEIQKHLRLAKK